MMFYLKIRFLKIPLKIITDYILQTDRRVGGRLSVLCRESMVRNLVGLVSEYPSGCLAADRTTLRPNSLRLNTLCLNTTAKQWFSFPMRMQSLVSLIEGLQDCIRRFSDFRIQNQATVR